MCVYIFILFSDTVLCGPDLFAAGRNLRARERVIPAAARAAAIAAVPDLLEKARAAALAAAPAVDQARIALLGSLRSLYFQHGAVVPSLEIYPNGSGVLHFAADRQHTELCLDLMMLFGCAAYRPNRDGKTPADYARARGDVALAALLEDAAALQLQLDAIELAAAPLPPLVSVPATAAAAAAAAAPPVTDAAAP
jgi:hypothetical protein